jgi:hypothetical protein
MSKLPCIKKFGPPFTGLTFCAAVAAALLTPSSSAALSCPFETWTIRLRTVTVGGESSELRAYWPEEAEYWRTSFGAFFNDYSVADPNTLHSIDFELPERDGGAP